MTDLLDDLIAFFEARNTGNATNELLNRCKEEKEKQLLIHGVVVSDCLGVKVDKSKATHKKEIRETVFKKGSSLNNN